VNRLTIRFMPTYVRKFHVNGRIHELSHNFQRSRGSCKWFDRHQKCVVEVSLCFKLELNTLGFFMSPQIENYRIEVNTLLGCTSKNVCGHVLVRTLSLFWCGELTAEICPSILDASLTHILGTLLISVMQTLLNRLSTMSTYNAIFTSNT
jgi:hypothetical protein